MVPIINILLVDDEQRNLDALEVILDDPRYRILRADDADKALLLLLENEVAAIVLDIKMPGVSGFELAKMIKGVRKYREIPIVFLTAYLVEDQDVIAGYGAGAVDYLTKPVNPLILRQRSQCSPSCSGRPARWPSSTRHWRSESTREPRSWRSR